MEPVLSAHRILLTSPLQEFAAVYGRARNVSVSATMSAESCGRQDLLDLGFQVVLLPDGGGRPLKNFVAAATELSAHPVDCLGLRVAASDAPYLSQ